MDVKCERCSTEYEFDDALVSGRGTTVKCTNCGHKFKIRRRDGDFSEDYWNVTTGDGRTLVFTSLRELQRAIQGYLVERNDRLSRGGLPPKPIGQIPELTPFFEQREAAKGQARVRNVQTHDGLGPPSPSVRPRQATMPEFPAPPAAFGAAPSGKSTLLGTGPVTSEEAFAAAPSSPTPMVSVPPPPRPPATDARREAPMVSTPPPASSPQREATRTAPLVRPTLPPAPVDDGPSTEPLPRISTAVAAPSNAGTSMPVAAAPEVPIAVESAPAGSVRLSAASLHLPAGTERRMQRSLLAEIEQERDRIRGPAASDPEPVPARRRSVGGFIVTTVVAAGVLMLGAVWAQKNLGAVLGAKPPASVPAADPRVATFLSTGEKALGDGNLDLAKESFDKASALSEKDPRVLLGLARLAAARADVLWLEQRLLPEDAADDHRVTRDGLVDLAAAARKAADDALAVAADDSAALRAKIDALRISGEPEAARALVGKIAPSAGQPESAYVLAALDLAEAEPLWPTILERLRTASSAETGPGRARAALVYALTRSGDGAGAAVEVERLSAMAKAHPLLPLLRRFAARARAIAAVDAGAVDRGGTSAATASTSSVRGGADAGKAVHAAGAAGPMPSDPRELVKQGERARTRGDHARARALFSAALDKNPNDSEALAGLAALAYASGDLAGARASFKRVLVGNPNYLPALVGLADVEWDSGDRGTATKMYKDIVDRYPEGAYPARVKQRNEGGG